MNIIRTGISRLSSATDKIVRMGGIEESEGRAMSVYITLFRNTPTVTLAAMRYGEIQAVCFLGRGDALEVLRLIDRAHSY